MANTFVKIATVTVGAGGSAAMDFNSIPSTYTDLNLVVSARAATSTSTACQITFNGSTTSYSWRRLIGDGSSAFSDSASSTTKIRAIGTDSSSYTASTFGNIQFYIPNYASANNKSLSVDGVTETNATGAESALLAGLWANSAAISSISVFPDSGNFAQYSTATLYGISKS